MISTSRWPHLLLLAICSSPLGLACLARPFEDPPLKPRVEDLQIFPQSLEKDIDLLFVIDNSNSMEGAQGNLQRNFPRFIEALRSPKLGALPGRTCTDSDRSGCKIPNVRIGVVSSDLGAGNFSFTTCEVPGGDGGRLRVGPGKLSPPGCPTPRDPWIMYSEGPGNTIVTNVQNAKSSDPVEQVKEAFSCVAFLGTGGCGFEHQLESARRALEGCQPGSQCKTNPGFIREDAYLAIVFVTNEDDCSAVTGDLFDPTQQGLEDPLGPLTSYRCFEKGFLCEGRPPGRQVGPRKSCVPALDYLHRVDSYVDFFGGLKPPGRVILFALAGPTGPVEVGRDGPYPALKPSCGSTQGTGVPGIRMASVVKSFGDRGHFNEGLVGDRKVEVNICSEDFTPALQLLGELIVGTLGAQCLSAPPLTRTGSLACHEGDRLGPGATCSASCLDQVDCVVEEQVGLSRPVLVKQCPAALFDGAIPPNACGADCPCWRVIPNSDCKPARHGSPYALQIMRSGPAPKGAQALVRCASVPFAWGSAEMARLPQCR